MGGYKEKKQGFPFFLNNMDYKMLGIYFAGLTNEFSHLLIYEI